MGKITIQGVRDNILTVELTFEQKNTYSLDEWYAEFARIQGITNTQRTPSDIWLLLMEDASKVAESIRKQKYADTLEPLAHVFNLTCSIAWRFTRDDMREAKITIPLSRIIWNKYPAHCPYCGKPKCICPVEMEYLEKLTDEEKEERAIEIAEFLSTERSRTEKIPDTLDGFTDMFNKIFSGSHYVKHIEDIAFHFLEEVGEVSSCLRDLRDMHEKKELHKVDEYRNNFEDEIADIFSWTTSILLKLNYILGAGKKFHEIYHENKNAKDVEQTVNLLLSDFTWRAYQTPDGKKLWCPLCLGKTCSCLPISP